jgi:hypothetical protein
MPMHAYHYDDENPFADDDADLKKYMDEKELGINAAMQRIQESMQKI